MTPPLNDGNPKAQAKLADRIRAAAGRSVNGVWMFPGKRGQYELYVYDWVGWDHQRNDYITRRDELPAQPWIVCEAVRLKGLGGGRHQADKAPIVFVSFHALQRLAERCNARTADDLLFGVRMLACSSNRLARASKSFRRSRHRFCA
jgi:hypothetical protein